MPIINRLPSGGGIEDANLIPDNIKAGVTIGEVVGIFTSDADATATSMLSGKTAYVKGVKITGTITSYQVGNVPTDATCSNQSGSSRLLVKIPVNGYYIAGVSLRLPYTAIVEALGITPDKILKGQSIAGVWGTVVAATTT